MKPSKLFNTILDQKLCTGCGVCISECKTKTLKMGWDEDGFLVPQGEKVEEFNDFDLRKVCPFNPEPDYEVQDEDKLSQIYLADANNFDKKIGRFEETYVGYSVEHRLTSSSGGIATYIFKKLLEKNIVDNLFVVVEHNGTYKYKLINNIDGIISISKTRYIPVTLERLFTEIENIDGKIAVSGVACFIKAIRLKQFYNPELREKIPFLVGIVCGGLKSRFFTEYLSQKAGISGQYFNPEYRIKDKNSLSSDYSFGAYDEKKIFHQMKMKPLGDMWGTGLFKANACDFCTDVLTELADISLGDAWLDEYRKDGLGNSIIVTRSKLADKLILEGIRNSDLNASTIQPDKVIKSQSSSFDHRQRAIKFRVFIGRLCGKIIPHVRKRMLGKISIPYKAVQIHRRRVRKQSLEIWRIHKSSSIFDRKMSVDLKILKSLTRIYHKLRKHIR